MTHREHPADLIARAQAHLGALCSVPTDRRPGSAGNREATAYAAGFVADAGWLVATPEFSVTDWHTDGGELTVAGCTIPLTPSPYGLGVAATGPIQVIRELADLDRLDLGGSIVVLAGPIAAEPLTPKAFPFYGSDEHAAIVAALEAAAPAAVLAVTGKYPALCGALDPFPLIEDGDFMVPTGNLRPADAAPLFDSHGAVASLEIRSSRLRSTAANVIATRGLPAPRITVIAHIDSKPGTPGAVDNAAGVVVLLLLAELLAPQQVSELPIGVELLVVNGEDHYAAPGELAWLADNEAHLEDIPLVINIDGAGYRGGRSAYSTYNLDAGLARHVDTSFGTAPTLIPGPEFYQSDHAIFAMRGRPALAITTELVDEMLETLFHSPDDTPSQVDIGLVVDAADAIANLILTYPVGRR